MRFRLDSTLSTNPGWRVDGGATRTLTARRNLARLACNGIVEREWSDPLAALDWLDRQPGKWVGFLAYELGFLLEPAARRLRDDRDGGGLLFAWGEVDDDWHNEPARARPAAPVRPASAAGEWTSTFSREAYLSAVARCIDYIAAGDIFQVNLSQRLSLPFRGSAEALYETLRQRSPAVYAALLELEEISLVSNSPELFLRVERQNVGGRRIVTRPITGTRPRAAGMEAALLASAKDAAELNMIIDLERNDLGRVCEIGSVRVTQPRTIEAHPTVYHGVATVEGRLRREVGLVDLLRATFPGGSITGAPKIRAMQIIDELEPVPRGAYCGAIGYRDGEGALELNVAIRTMTLEHETGLLHIPVGGGIVADSVPEEEYEETLVKARAGLDAVRVLEGVLPPAEAGEAEGALRLR